MNNIKFKFAQQDAYNSVLKNNLLHILSPVITSAKIFSIHFPLGFKIILKLGSFILQLFQVICIFQFQNA